MMRWMSAWLNALWCPGSPMALSAAVVSGVCALLFALPAAVTFGGLWWAVFVLLALPWLAAALGAVSVLFLAAVERIDA